MQWGWFLVKNRFAGHGEGQHQRLPRKRLSRESVSIVWSLSQYRFSLDVPNYLCCCCCHHCLNRFKKLAPCVLLLLSQQTQTHLRIHCWWHALTQTLTGITSLFNTSEERGANATRRSSKQKCLHSVSLMEGGETRYFEMVYTCFLRTRTNCWRWLAKMQRSSSSRTTKKRSDNVSRSATNVEWWIEEELIDALVLFILNFHILVARVFFPNLNARLSSLPACFR